MTDNNNNDAEAYLARIRKTIAESNALVSQVELRIAETDRLLARQGLTREQVMAMRFTPEQIEAANAAMTRMGIEPPDYMPQPPEETPAPQPVADSGDVDERSKKFGMMMKPFRI